MKLAIVTSSFPLREHDPSAAAGVFVRDIAISLARQGHQVHVLTQDKGYGCEFEPDGVRVECFPWPGTDTPLSRLNPLNPVDAAKAWQLMKSGRQALFELHDRIGLDHTIAMWAVPGGSFARSLQKSKGVPYSVWCLGSDIWTYGRIPLLRSVVSGVLKGAEHLYADGVALAREATKLCDRDVEFLPSSRLLDAATDVEPVRPDRASPQFLFVGRYAEVKGVDIMLDAFAKFVKQTGSGSLQLLGGGPWDQLVRDKVSDLGVSDRVTVGGFADLETVIAHAKAADVWLIPSRMESIPLVLSDAVRLGLPVIVTDVGDMGDLLRAHKAGLVVPPEDAAALCEAMLEFYRSPEDRFESEIAALGNMFDPARAAAVLLERAQGGAP